MKYLPLAVPLAGALLLTGCSGLTESGSELNSKVPESIGDYKLITRADVSQAGFCEGPTAQELGGSGEAYTGEFLYLLDGYKLPSGQGNCVGSSAFNVAGSDGMLRIVVDNYTGPFTEAGCKTRILGGGRYITACTQILDNLTVQSEGVQIGSQDEYRAQLDRLGKDFIKKADLSF